MAAIALENVVVDDYSHAMEEHPLEAPLVRDCLAKKGAYMSFQVEKDKRYLRVCILHEATGNLGAQIGFQVVDIVKGIAKERTAYIRPAIQSIKDLLEYARRMGYPRFKSP